LTNVDINSITVQNQNQLEASQITQNTLNANQNAENTLGASRSSENMLGANQSSEMPSTEDQVETNPVD
jgi:hypothetical protein